MAYLTTRRDPDEVLVVLFKHLAFESPEKSAEAGRPIFEDVEVCEIRAPGCKDVKVFPATFFSRWVDDPFTGMQRKESYAERFSHQYQQFKARANQTKIGTPLEHAPFLTDARRAEFRAQNIYTVEALAAIDGNELKNLGPGGRDFKNQALEFIEQASASVPNKRIEAELEALRAQNAVLQEDNAALRSARQQAERELEEMSDEQLSGYITSQTGSPPQGVLPRKVLKRMALDAGPKVT